MNKEELKVLAQDFLSDMIKVFRDNNELSFDEAYKIVESKWLTCWKPEEYGDFPRENYYKVKKLDQRYYEELGFYKQIRKHKEINKDN